ncbi:unnamed protein product [Adineta ricciae]|uniref:Uncharacterized protein n=1 Tax=Adineta ricciae TaxID=249248 RepID=A0A815SKQ1_ADIRI|nr:unnamed protein product [Adineta ricciae]
MILVGINAVNRLNNPQTIGFDSLGSLCATDKGNNRIQKFLLKGNFYARTITFSSTTGKFNYHLPFCQ